MGFNLYILESIDFLHLHKNCWKHLNKYLFQSFQSTIFGLWSLNVAGKVYNNDTTRVPHLKDHPRTCKRFIPMVCFRPLRIGLWDPFTHGLNGLKMVVTNYLLSGNPPSKGWTRSSGKDPFGCFPISGFFLLSELFHRQPGFFHWRGIAGPPPANMQSHESHINNPPAKPPAWT